MNIIGQNGNDGIHYDQEEMIQKNEETLATKKVEPQPKNKNKNRPWSSTKVVS